MNPLILELSSPLVAAIGWTLIHFLWQGLLLAALLQLILPLCRSAAARHNWAVGTLATMCLAPLATFMWLHHVMGGGADAIAFPAPGSITATLGQLKQASASMPWVGWLVVLWLAGVTLLSVRALGGLVLARKILRESFALPADLGKRCRGLQRRLGMHARIQFLQTCRASVPVMVGWLRPAILIPAAAISGLAPEQLDALILHELAHVRRLDAFVNLLLLTAETILFYHPAVWWVSRRVRIEREHCCDDFAVAHSDAAIFVEALTSLALSTATPAHLLAANGGSLKDRVSRLLGGPSDARKFSLSAFAGFLFLGLFIATVATAQVNGRTGHQDFTIRAVDEGGGQGTRNRPNDDLVQMFRPGRNNPGALWLKRQGAIAGDPLADARAGVGPQGNAIIYFHLTPDAARKFAALTRENVGHQLAVVVNGKVVTAPVVADPILGGTGEITGDFTMDQARTMVAKMMGTGAPAGP